jgi:cell division protein FtsQ
VIDALVERLQRLPSRLPVFRGIRVSPRIAIGIVTAIVLLVAGWMWFRDSSLVAVKRVRITGVSGPDAHRIRQALLAAARNMTTLDADTGALQTAVSPFPVVKSVSATTQFPHGMRIHVTEQIPVAAVVVSGRAIAVASDGTLLHDVSATHGLPSIPVDVAPGGARLTDRAALDAVMVLAAAPYAMLARVTEVTTIAQHGLVAQLQNGPSIYFGDTTDLGAKWRAATRVLADAGSAGASYIDVTDPERPAAGGPLASSTSTAGTGGSSGQ